MLDFLFGSKDPMSMDEYWTIRDLYECSNKTEADKLKRGRNRAFKKHDKALWVRAHNWDLWGAAFVICGGCSDDGFQDFKGGVLNLEAKYLRPALESADNLADVPPEILKTLRGEEWGSIGTAEPSGEPWEEEDLEARFPRLWVKYGEHPIDEDDVDD